jgi:hypothetical protein
MSQDKAMSLQQILLMRLIKEEICATRCGRGWKLEGELYRELNNLGSMP